MKTIVILLAIVLVGLGANSNAKEVRTWLNVSPTAGGPIFPDRTDPDRWYALSWYGGNVYRSDNGGRLWQKLDSPLVFRFLVHPFDGTLYVVNEDRTSDPSRYFLYVSNDHGESFVPAGELGTFWINLHIDPANSNTLLQACRKGSLQEI